VFVVLALLAAAILDRGPYNVLVRLGVASAFLSLAAVSYEAAIASAHGYGTVLKAIDVLDTQRTVRKAALLPSDVAGRSNVKGLGCFADHIPGT